MEPMTIPEAASSRRVPRVIRNRLAASVAVLVVLGAVLTVGGFAAMGIAVGDINHDNRTTDRLAASEESLHLALVAQEAHVLAYLLAPADTVLEEFEEAVDAELAAYIQLGQIAPDDTAIQTAALNVRRLATEWRETWAEPYLRSGASEITESGGTALRTSQELFSPVRDGIADLRAITQVRREASSTALATFVGNMEAVFVPAMLVIGILVMAAGIWLIRSISGPLHRLNRTAQALVAGERVTFVPEQDDEIGALAFVLERMRLDAGTRYDSARSEAETAATFNQLAELTSFAQNEETLVGAATRVLARIAPSPRGQVMLLNNSTNRLVVAATWGEGMPEIGAPADLDRPDRCPGIRRATAYVAEDLSDDLAVRCPAHPAASGSVVCLPMPALGSIVGVVHLERPEPRSFDGISVQRAARTAEQVALALANARLMKTMEGLANTDPLTGLRNARFFDAFLEHHFALAEREKESVGVIMLDVDHFKQFNDNHGHPAGDEALRTLSRAIGSVLRASDVVARYGGEEFIIALPHSKLADVRVVAEKLRSAIEQAVVEIGPGRYGRITASFGIVATDAHRVDRKGLVSLADAALYRAKAAGRNRVETSPTSTTDLDEAGQRRWGRTPDEPIVLPVGAARRSRKRQPAAKVTT